VLPVLFKVELHTQKGPSFVSIQLVLQKVPFRYECRRPATWRCDIENNATITVIVVACSHKDFFGWGSSELLKHWQEFVNQRYMLESCWMKMILACCGMSWRYAATPCYLSDLMSDYSINRYDNSGNWAGFIFFPYPEMSARELGGVHPLPLAMIRFILLQNRQGKTRLSKWYVPFNAVEKFKIESEIHRAVVTRDPRNTNFLEYRSYKIIYRRYAGMFFIFCASW